MNCKPKDTRTLNSVERQMECLLAERDEARRERDEYKKAAIAAVEGRCQNVYNWYHGDTG